jgi:serine/threonine-protein kinase
LRQFQAVPPQTGTSAEPRDIDPQPIARATGFDVAQWKEVTPPYAPLYAFDRIKAWQGKHPRLDMTVTVQASAWRGRLAELTVIWPWSKPARMPEQHRPDLSGMLRDLLENATSSLVFLFSAFLAFRNLRAGRGDRRGATRLAAAYLLLMAIQSVCMMHWVADMGMVTVLATKARMWVTSAALMWLLYVGLEPVVRARWPRSIVTWSRVLVGRWRDPLVGAHILYGALLGLVIVASFIVSQYLGMRHRELGALAGADVGISTRVWIATVAATARGAVEFGLMAMFALFCFRVLLRFDWAASAAAAVLFSLEEGEVWRSGHLLDFVFFLVIFAGLTFVLVRLGLVSMMTALFFVNLLLQTPAPQTFSKPYEWTVVLYPLLALAIVAWAFWRTSGDRLLAPASAASNTASGLS